MERYFIALQQLGAKNELLLKIITEYEPTFMNNLFEENSDIFLTNIEWLPYKSLFEDREKVNIALKNADKILKINAEQKIHTALYHTINYPKNLMRIDNRLLLFITKVRIQMKDLIKPLHLSEHESQHALDLMPSII